MVTKMAMMMMIIVIKVVMMMILNGILIVYMLMIMLDTMMLKRTISGDGSSNLKQHLDSLPAHGPSQRDGPRHCLLQALLL